MRLWRKPHCCWRNCLPSTSTHRIPAPKKVTVEALPYVRIRCCRCSDESALVERLHGERVQAGRRSTGTSRVERPPPATGDNEATLPEKAALKTAESAPVEDPYYPDKSNPEVDTLHYFLDLDWDGSTLTGTATVTFRATEDTDTIRLDLADELEVDEVQIDGESIDFDQSDDGLVMQTGALEADSRHTVSIAYSGEPAPTEAPSLRTDMGEGLGWQTDVDGNVFTFQEPYGAFTWYPVNDHPSDEALYDARITAHDGDVAVFNGKLQASDVDGDTTTNTWHLEEPAASYLTTIAIGPYTEHVDKTPGGMDISYWLTDRDEHLYEQMAEEGGKSFDWLVQHAGPYPFDSLGVVVVAGNSAMETETMITMSASAVERPDAVLQHEMAHQWFGDSLTPRTWQGVWLNEGFAMYYQQWYETDQGRQPYGGGLAQWSYYDQLSRDMSGPPGDFNPDSFGDSNVYLSPALMLDVIRQRVGDKTFERLLKAWAREHEGATVDREVFTTWLNQKTGKNFTPLIAKWLDTEKTPVYISR